MVNLIVSTKDIIGSSYVISVQGVAETEVKTPVKLTNQQALRKIADYLDNTAAYLRRKRLEAQH
jgi:hypothetical protein